jgi:hypothetical protein
MKTVSLGEDRKIRRSHPANGYAGWCFANTDPRGPDRPGQFGTESSS